MRELNDVFKIDTNELTAKCISSILDEGIDHSEKERFY